jgi:nucleotide-binding universal stress UspA family protein
MYDDILVPTDGSEGSLRAVDHALTLASSFDATLHAVYVVELNALPAEFDAGDVFEDLEAEGRRALDAVRERAEGTDVSVEARVGSGPPHRVILDYVDEHDVDLVVMATHGRTGLDRYLLGSVTEKVVRLADVPVLTVRLDEESRETDAGE